MDTTATHFPTQFANVDNIKSTLDLIYGAASDITQENDFYML